MIIENSKFDRRILSDYLGFQINLIGGNCRRCGKFYKIRFDEGEIYIEEVVERGGNKCFECEERKQQMETRHQKILAELSPNF